MSLETLLNATNEVDVLGMAARIAEEPEREAPSASSACVLALALSVLQLWDIAEAALEIDAALDAAGEAAGGGSPEGFHMVLGPEAVATLALLKIRLRCIEPKFPATQGNA